jgi:ParB family transcriptional regulator, chromosome partitioning protein
MAKPALGRGLGALLSGVPAAPKPAVSPNNSSASSSLQNGGIVQEQVQRIPLQKIQPCAFQPRKDFSEESLRELADSIKEQGIIQPLVVRAQGDRFELIAGERRWRAAQIVGLADVPVIVRRADDATVLELALIENLQRENLNALEEALGYSQLIDQFKLTQEEAAVKVGKSRAVVANALRLLKLPQELQRYVRDGRLSVGHAKVILGLLRHEEQKLAAERVLKEGLNVRQTEELVSSLQNRGAAVVGGSSKPHSSPAPDVHVRDIEDRLQQRLGTKTQLRYRQGKGSIEIRFFSDDDLERILNLLGLQPE